MSVLINEMKNASNVLSKELHSHNTSHPDERFCFIICREQCILKDCKSPTCSSSICAVCSNTFIKRLSENADVRRESINDKALKPT